MNQNKISEIIKDICKQHKIKYTSLSDAKRLGKLILELNAISDEIYTILDRHNIETTFKKDIENDLFDLHTIDHDLIKLAKQLKHE
jgi:ribosomal protein L7Ae-like RNA K-turn-binding protein